MASMLNQRPSSSEQSSPEDLTLVPSTSRQGSQEQKEREEQEEDEEQEEEEEESFENFRMPQYPVPMRTTIEERDLSLDSSQTTKIYDKCLCELGDKIKISFPGPSGGQISDDVVIEYKTIGKIAILRDDLQDVLAFATKSKTYEVMFFSKNKKALHEAHHTIRFKRDLAVIRESLVLTFTDNRDNIRRISWAEYREFLNPMDKVHDAWLNCKLSKYDTVPLLCDLLRYWLELRKELINGERYPMHLLEKLRNLKEERSFVVIVEHLTLFYYHPCPEMVMFVNDLVRYWKYTAGEPITTFVLKFLEYKVNNLVDVRTSVQMPNIVASILFNIVRSEGGIRELEKVLGCSNATSKFAPTNFAIVSLMGLTSLYMDNQPGCNVPCNCIIDCERFKREMPELIAKDFQHEEPTTIPTEPLDLSVNNRTIPGAPVQSMVDNFFDPYDKLEWVNFEDMLRMPPAEKLTFSETDIQVHRDFLTCLWLHTIDKVQSSRQEIFIGRILKAFPFYERAMLDFVFRICLVKVKRKYELPLLLPCVSPTLRPMEECNIHTFIRYGFRVEPRISQYGLEYAVQTWGGALFRT